MSDDEREAAGSALAELRSRVDAHFDRVAEADADAIACAVGCDQCCHVRLSVFSIEAQRIAAALNRIAGRDPALRGRIRRQADDPSHAGKCALLVDGQCSVYAERPMICRSHGLMVVVEDGETTEQTCCPLNYRERGPSPGNALRLAAINRPLSVMARLWDPQEDGRRVELAELARAGDA